MHTAKATPEQEQGALDEMNADLIAHGEAPFTLGQFRRVTAMAMEWAAEVERRTMSRLLATLAKRVMEEKTQQGN